MNLMELNKKDAVILLDKCMKEQMCMHRISELDERNLTIDKLLQEALKIIPQGWFYQEKTKVQIKFDGKTYETIGFQHSGQSFSEKIEIRENNFLTVTVTPKSDRPTAENKPFHQSETLLLNFIATQLSKKTNYILSLNELKEQQLFLEKAYNLAHIGSWEFDMKTHDLYWSPITKEVHGFDQDYDPDLESTIQLFKEGINRETFRKAAMDAIEKQKPFDVELKIISGRGDERWIRATGEPEYKNGECTRFYGISQDVSVRRQAEENLLFSERRFKSLVQDSTDLLAILDSQGNYLFVSPTSNSILGIPAKQLLGTNAFDYIHDEDKKRLISHLDNMSPGTQVNIAPFRFRDADGHWRWIETTLTDKTDDPAVGGLVANSRDVTRQIEQQLQNLDSIREKETLLTEIHHRVKNNLAVVSGMIQLQLMEEDNMAIRDRLLDSISRIKTMANIHEQLYKSKSFSKLDLADNIKSLVLNIKKTFQTNIPVDIEFDCELVQININQAIPFSQIVNEVVTNIFKHAYPGRAHGSVRIFLKEFDKHLVKLIIRDDGVGMSKDMETIDKSSLGLKLIRVLSRQLKAESEYHSDENGTTFQLKFTKDEMKGIGNISLE